MPATPEEITEITRLINSCADMLKYLGEVRKDIEAERAELKKALQHIATQEEWQTPVLQNGWIPYEYGYNTPRFFKDKFGMVHIKGLVKLGVDALIFNLPQGYRPDGREIHATCTHPNIISRIDVLPNGDVIRVTGDPSWLALDGITFRAA